MELTYTTVFHCEFVVCRNKNTDSTNHSIMSTETVSRMLQMSERAVPRTHELVEAPSGPCKSKAVMKTDPSTRMSSNRGQSSEPHELEGSIILTEDCQTVQPSHSTTGIDETLTAVMHLYEDGLLQNNLSDNGIMQSNDCPTHFPPPYSNNLDILTFLPPATMTSLHPTFSYPLPSLDDMATF
jgi:hypothetical protein